MTPTTIDVIYPDPRAELFLRGEGAQLSWQRSLPPLHVNGTCRSFQLELEAGDLAEFKVVRGDDWSRERNFSVVAGEARRVRPHFERSTGTLLDEQTLHADSLGCWMVHQVFLPPSYREHVDRRYPLLLLQDGHVVFSSGGDAFGPSWQVDTTLDGLYELGAVDHVIVVGLHTREDRTAILSPTADRLHGGGRGPAYLAYITDTLLPYLGERYRVAQGPANTAVAGSSMGGLFSFWAAWQRPDVFGKCACLSGSFWWDDRNAVRAVRDGGCPFPQPIFYLDSGAAHSAFEEDANLRDGFHHTSALRAALANHCYRPGENLHTLAFAGAAHNNSAWAARIATPLQLLFPRGDD